MTDIWAPVVAGGVTGLSGFGAIAWQQWRMAKRAKSDAQEAAHRLLVAHSLSFTILAQALRTTAQLRSGLSEGLDVVLGLRGPLDPLEIYDRLAEGFGPINAAWATIKVSGSSETGDLADKLVHACADLLAVAGEIGTARGAVETRLKGPAWTQEQQEGLQAAVDKVMTTRKSFIEHARKTFADQP